MLIGNKIYTDAPTMIMLMIDTRSLKPHSQDNTRRPVLFSACCSTCPADTPSKVWRKPKAKQNIDSLKLQLCDEYSKACRYTIEYYQVTLNL